MKTETIKYRQMIVLLVLLLPSGRLYAGSGGTHFTTGAVAGKYFSIPADRVGGNTFISNTSAFISGIMSHMALDAYYQYEPSFNAKASNTRYFQIEGGLSFLLLIKAYKTDPRIFWGSLGGIFPDLEHSLGLKEKYFPTHNGEIPELNFDGLSWGILQNFSINLSSLYLVYRGPSDIHSTRFPIELSVGGSYQPVTIENDDKRNLIMPSLSIGIELTPEITLAHEFKYMIYEQNETEIPDNFYRTRRIITWNLIILRYNINNTFDSFSFFAHIKNGIGIANMVKPSKKGDLAFGNVSSSEFVSAAGVGFKLHIARSICVGVNCDYHLRDILDELHEVEDFNRFQPTFHMTLYPETM